jgi:hypothetical protein
MTKMKISIEFPSKEFLEHLQLENNNRVLFSGPFGIGKTTFIKNFFDDQKDGYFTIFLRPVNYSIASNEDIYKLIKYDILYKLLQEDLVKVDDFGTFNKFEILTNFLATEPLESFIPFIKAIPEVGGEVSEVLTGLDKLTSSLKKFKKNINTNVDAKRVVSFLSKTEAHYLLENDFITALIKSTISRINKSLKNGGVVLIVDDLDRIDPEHIFRLFNIFSTHFDYNSEAQNKFGFHKIVFVCDVINVRSIFQAKYGVKTDFNGYIDKFYSSTIFNYNNRSAISTFISDHIPDVLLKRLIGNEFNLLVDILCSFLEYGLINLRNLTKVVDLRDDSHSSKVINLKKIDKSIFERFGFTYIGMVLTYLIGDVNSLITLINKGIEINSSSREKLGIYKLPKEKIYFSKYFLPILEYNANGTVEDKMFTFSNGKYNCRYMLKLKNELSYRYEGELEHEYGFPAGMTWTWLVNSTMVLKEHGILV